MKKNMILALLLIFVSIVHAGVLFVGLESDGIPTYSSDLEGFPNISWETLYSCEVSGAAATPDGIIYLIEGAFTTHLYSATLTSSPQQICTISEDMSALAFGRGTLYGYSNYADPKGIYSIDPDTGTATLVLDVYTGTGYRFFGLDYNPEDDLFYGYTEYGTSGLHSINIDTGEMIHLVGTIPASNGQGRGLAVGNNTVYLTATRGDDGIPYFAYDISQGVGGSWVEFPNPYPDHHSTGGAAFIPDIIPTIQITGSVVGSDAPTSGIAGCDVNLSGDENYQTTTDMFGNFIFPEVLAETNYEIEITYDNYEPYFSEIQAGLDDLDLGTITLIEIASPPMNVVAIQNDEETEAIITWEAPDTGQDREFQDYRIYRFLEVYNGMPSLWELIAQNVTDTFYIDTQWAQLTPEVYQFAVVAVYSNGVESDPILSNSLEKFPVIADENIILKKNRISNYPNPFNPDTTIKLDLVKSGETKLTIYNMQGKKVKKLIDAYYKKGVYEIYWDGQNDGGEAVASGNYIIKLQQDGKETTRKMLLLK